MQIEQTALEIIFQDAVHAFPDECCGFLYGTETTDERTVLEARSVDNAKEGDKRRRFVITPKDYLRAERYADENNLVLLGVYHSHPDHPAVPSETDRLAAQPFFSYVIVSVMAGKVAKIRSWVLNDQQQFEEETISTPQLNNI